MSNCPICLSQAEWSRSADDDAHCACGSCGSFWLSVAAQAVLEAYGEPLNRERLSEAVRDVCGKAAPAAPRIDEAVISRLIGLSAL